MPTNLSDDERISQILYLHGRAACTCKHAFDRHIDPHFPDHNPDLVITGHCLEPDCDCTQYATPRTSL